MEHKMIIGKHAKRCNRALNKCWPSAGDTSGWPQVCLYAPNEHCGYLFLHALLPSCTKLCISSVNMLLQTLAMYRITTSTQTCKMNDKRKNQDKPFFDCRAPFLRHELPLQLCATVRWELISISHFSQCTANSETLHFRCTVLENFNRPWAHQQNQ